MATPNSARTTGAKDIAKLFSVTRKTVSNWAAIGAPHSRTGGGYLRFHVAELVRWADMHLVRKDGRPYSQVVSAHAVQVGPAHEPYAIDDLFMGVASAVDQELDGLLGRLESAGIDQATLDLLEAELFATSEAIVDHLEDACETLSKARPEAGEFRAEPREGRDPITPRPVEGGKS
jgi:DNA-binding transcriptional MerR regulator